MRLKRGHSRAIGMVVAAVGIAAMSPQMSQAAVVAFDFDGTIVRSQDPSNLLSGGFKSGDPFSGQVVYDTSKAQPSFALGVYYFLEGGSITFTSGGHTFAGSTAASTQSCWPAADNCIPPFTIDVRDNSAGSDGLFYGAAYLTYDGQTAPGSPARSGLLLLLTDSSQSALSSKALPIAPPDFSAFDRHIVNLFAAGPDFMSPPLYSIDGEVTSISAPSAVPEPGTMTLFLAGFVGLILVGARRRKFGIPSLS